MPSAEVKSGVWALRGGVRTACEYRRSTWNGYYKSHCATGAVAANHRARRAPTSSLRCMVGFAVRRALRGMGVKFSLGLFPERLFLNLQNCVFEKLSNYDGLTIVEFHCLRSWVRILATVAENRVATTPSTQFDALGPLAGGS